MFMIHTIKPHGAINIKVINKINQKGDKYYLLDDYGWWEITFEDYDYLEKRGIEIYGRNGATL